MAFNITEEITKHMFDNRREILNFDKKEFAAKTCSRIENIVTNNVVRYSPPTIFTRST
jgi:hypothetical protein